MFINVFGFTFGIMQCKHYWSMILKYWVNTPGANLGFAILIPVFSIIFKNMSVWLFVLWSPVIPASLALKSPIMNRLWHLFLKALISFVKCLKKYPCSIMSISFLYCFNFIGEIMFMIYQYSTNFIFYALMCLWGFMDYQFISLKFP
eukprot:369216_1